MRKGLIIVLALVALLALPAVVAADSLPMKGDVNGDGRCNTVDAMLIARYTVDPTATGGVLATPFTDEAVLCADVNGDGRVTIVDAMLVSRYAIDSTGAGGIHVSNWPSLWEGSTEFAPPAP